MGGKKETAQPAVSFSSENEPALGVSFFAKEQKIATDKKHLKGQWQIERNGEVVTSNVRKGDEFSNKVDFGIEKGEEQYAKNLENVIQGEKSGIIGKVEIKGKQEEIRLTEKSFLHIFKKHRVFNPNNLIATVNRPDYTITNVTTKDTSIGLQLNNKNKINLFKKLDDQHFLVV
ncbi:MAG: hypothetical protein Q4B28_05215 [bacterium]|nr:hypothetical protein [bacterium]